MRTRPSLLVTLTILIAFVVAACGTPALEDFENAAPPDAGGATAIAIGSRARGGSGGRSSASRGGASSKTDGGATLAASGGAASSPVDPEPLPSAGGAAASAGGAPTSSTPKPSGGRVATGGATSPSAGAVSAGGVSETSDGGSAGSESTASGGVNEPSAGAPAQPSAGQAGEPTRPEIPGGGAPGSGGEANAGAPPIEPPERSLWFSEYVEGSSNFKALEISTRDEQSTSGCQIEIFSNGESDSPSSFALNATLSPAAPLVVCTEELTAKLSDVCLPLRLNFNGNDAVVLRCEGAVIDAIGQVGTPVDKQWGDGELRTLDMTLRRACDVSAGDPIASDVFDPASEWEAVATNEFGGLGTHCTEAQ